MGPPSRLKTATWDSPAQPANGIISQLMQLVPRTNGFQRHCWTLIPLILTYVLQRVEYVLDTRFISVLGTQALSAHSISYNLFLVGQAIGIATATSALILWKRKEMLQAQRTLLRNHTLIALATGILGSALVMPALPLIIQHFKVSASFSSTAYTYLALGTLNLILQAVYGTLNAMLIAADQRLKSMLLIAGVLAAKLLFGIFCIQYLWNGSGAAEDILVPMVNIMAFGIFALAIAAFLAYRQIYRHAVGSTKVPLREITNVWVSELGISIIRSATPIVFSLQLAGVDSDNFFVTFQLALQLAFILVMPLQVGAQLAVRDASEDQSRRDSKSLTPLQNTAWFGNYFYASLGPTQLLLGIGAAFPGTLLLLVFGYDTPPSHYPFLHLYFLGCMIGQVGNLMIIRIRSLKQNSNVTKNSLFSEVVVQLGLMQLFLWSGRNSAAAVGVVTLAYCTSHLVLNFNTAKRLQKQIL